MSKPASTTMTRRHVQIAFQEEQAVAVESPAELEPQMGARGRWFLGAGLLVLLVFLVYLPSLRAGFIFNDDANVTANAAIRSWRGLWAIWRLPYNFPQFSPVTYTSLMLEFELWGITAKSAAAGYHAGNIMLHAINALLIWTLASKLSLRGAWTAAAVFALHPLAVQSVTWISQRPVLLGEMFALLSLLVFLRFAGINPTPIEPRTIFRLPSARWLVYAIALFLFVLAILSDATTAVFPLVVLVLIWWKRGRMSFASDVKPLIPFLIVSLATVAGAIAVALRFPSSTSSIDSTVTLTGIERILIAARAIWFYLVSAILPLRLSFAYPRWDVSATSIWQWTLVFALIVVCWGMWRMRTRWGRGPIACAAMFALLILPAAIVVNPSANRGGFVADSAAYLALAAIVVPVIAVLANRLAMRERFARSVAMEPLLSGVAILAFGALTVYNQQPFRSQEQLWADTVEKYPRSLYALNRMGEFELDRRHVTKAEEHFRRAIAIDPTDKTTLINLGRIFESRGEWDKAISQYYLILRDHPDDSDAHFGLGSAFNGQGNTNEAINQYQIVLKLSANYYQAWNNLGVIYMLRNEYSEAEAQFLRALQIDPRQTSARINLADLYYQMGRVQDAVNELGRVMEIDPRNVQAIFNAGSILGNRKDFAHAEYLFKIAIGYDDQFAAAYDNLGIALAAQAIRDPHQRGKLKEAVFCFGRAHDLEPDVEKYRDHLERAQRESDAQQAPTN